MMALHLHLEARTTGAGLVCAPDPRAAEAGASILRAGGNAVDAAVAAAFAIGVVEPHMSGIGGGTWMILALTPGDRHVVVEGPVLAPDAARPDMFRLSGDDTPAGLYGWPHVEGDANIAGPLSVGVPGTVAALHAAQSTFGAVGFRQVVEPAIRLAADGIEVNWFTSALVTTEAARLAQDPGCAELFLPGGLPLRPRGLQPGDILRQPRLAETLQEISDVGPVAFYRGRIGRSLVNYVRGHGGIVSVADLDRYAALIHETPATGFFRSAEILGPPRTGVPTVIETLQIAERMEWADRPAAQAVAWARALLLAFRDRFRWMTADPAASVPWDALLSARYADGLRKAFLAGEDLPEPDGCQESKGTGLAHPAGSSGCTSHISAVDRDGNLVSLTQTVLDIFGARMLDPDTGVLLNDGMMWFDPRPGRVNQIRPGCPGMSAVSPVIMRTPDGTKAAVGAAGGRKVISSTAQVAAYVVAGDSAQDAIERPRIHAESTAVLVDARWPTDAVEALAQAGFVPTVAEEEPTTWNFGRPGCVLIKPGGIRNGGVDPVKPGGIAIE